MPSADEIENRRATNSAKLLEKLMVKAFDGNVDCLRFTHPELASELFQVFAALHLDDNGITVMQAIIFAKCIRTKTENPP